MNIITVNLIENDIAMPAKLIKKIEGRVWSVPCAEAEVTVMQERFRVTNIAKNDTGVSLRILCETKPEDHAVNVSLSLEDYI